MDDALVAFEQARSQVEDALRAAEHDPTRAERVEQRLFALRAAARKYGVPIDELNALAARFAAELKLVDAGAAELAQLQAAAEQARQAYDSAAGALSQGRREAAEKLDRAVTRELAPLRLERAQFLTALTADARTQGRHGFDHVEFWVRTNPGTRAGPLMRVASGGELARFLLAVKVVLAQRGSAPVLVFDEIDSGAAGAVADAIGSRLARLGRHSQVIAVTHAPQVAARADHHYLISKRVLDGGRRAATSVVELAADKRREEIARMLAGAEVTAEARAAAERLIKAAG